MWGWWNAKVPIVEAVFSVGGSHSEKTLGNLGQRLQGSLVSMDIAGRQRPAKNPQCQIRMSSCWNRSWKHAPSWEYSSVRRVDPKNSIAGDANSRGYSRGANRAFDHFNDLCSDLGTVCMWCLRKFHVQMTNDEPFDGHSLVFRTLSTSFFYWKMRWLCRCK